MPSPYGKVTITDCCAAAGGADRNSPEQFLANVNAVDHGHYLKMSVRSDGSFTMTNKRNGFTKSYSARAK